MCSAGSGGWRGEPATAIKGQKGKYLRAERHRKPKSRSRGRGGPAGSPSRGETGVSGQSWEESEAKAFGVGARRWPGVHLPHPRAPGMAREAVRAETETWEQRVSKLTGGRGKMRWIGRNGRLPETLTLPTA
ncbi:hypothetical protein J1605_010109 [Eschrichtius robustus]|uniref:Uncharacterized protein n=1 Tax=Eschrichtius robustus TaxID=9764 RepID=A0AB34GSC7_ESCRO|nr:hypothetical protein J1605_010109 [Eschrichtius robustus]